jgi:DNA topoisomerase-1
METSVVIVESNKKCASIEEYLNTNSPLMAYRCVACFGHVRELPDLKHIDIGNNFHPSYTEIETPMKQKQIAYIRKLIDQFGKKNVILASDKDREGEAIAWHLCQVFGLNVQTTRRITFSEISMTALKAAIHSPYQIIDMQLVYAQQARQILDVLIGFQISPVLWRQFTQGLSAGRCQTPTLALVYDNYMERKTAETKLTWNITGYFTHHAYPFSLTNTDELLDIEPFLESEKTWQHALSVGPSKQVIRQPPEPFTTSTLQQLAHSELHTSPKMTMQLAQLLYESGYITYMRTDSKTYSPEFVEKVKGLIHIKYSGKDFGQMWENPHIHTTTDEYPHEAIRPVHIEVEEAHTDNSKANRLYAMIWRRAMESCMAPAIVSTLTGQITSSKPNSVYVKQCEKTVFAGWTIVQTKGQPSEIPPMYLYLEEKNKQSIPAPSIPAPSMQVVPYKFITVNTTMHGTKPLLTEAGLVKRLEEMGIGRPSTTASLVDKIQERDYVQIGDVEGTKQLCIDYKLTGTKIERIEVEKEFGKEKGKLIIQPLGLMVSEYLRQHFSDLFNYSYTKEMEMKLDDVAENKRAWVSVCQECQDVIRRLIPVMSPSGNNKAKPEKGIRIDDNHMYIFSKNGPVIKQIGADLPKPIFKKCIKNINIDRLIRGEYTLDELLDKSSVEPVIVPPIGKWNGFDVFVKRGKFSLYATWLNEKGERQMKSLKQFGNRPPENIRWDEVEPVLLVDELPKPPKFEPKTSKKGGYKKK